jgi:hypothetical protein
MDTFKMARGKNVVQGLFIYDFVLVEVKLRALCVDLEVSSLVGGRFWHENTRLEGGDKCAKVVTLESSIFSILDCMLDYSRKSLGF